MAACSVWAEMSADKENLGIKHAGFLKSVAFGVACTIPQ
jgi:hypothetical protein